VMAQDSTSLRGVNTAFPREKLQQAVSFFP